MSLFLRYEDMWDRALGGTTDEKQIPHWFANFAYVLIGFVFKVLFRYRVDGRENLRAFKDRCGAVVVSNHTSFLDVVLMYMAARPSQFVRLMGRDSLFGMAWRGRSSRAWARSPSSAIRPTAPPSSAQRTC